VSAARGMAVVRRVLPAPPEAVFDEWLDPAGMTEWMCPRPARAARIVLDPRVGGLLHIDIEDGGALVSVTGAFRALERPRLLSFTWSSSHWPDPSAQSVVTVTLEPHGAADTLMTIEHELLPPEEAGRFRLGWEQIAAQLLAVLAGGHTRMP
jgi:uncharacterized protein YndB with AHSA1/START domain